MLTRFLNLVISLALPRPDCSILDRQMAPASAMLLTVATCLAGFDEILTSQWGASQPGALSILETYGTWPVIRLTGT
jgi:hypothetical protein